MSLVLDLPEDLAASLESEAARLGLSLPDYAIRLLASASLRPSQVRTGADLVAYWRAEGLIGTRPEITDSQAHARSIRDASTRGLGPRPGSPPSPGRNDERDDSD